MAKGHAAERGGRRGDLVERVTAGFLLGAVVLVALAWTGRTAGWFLEAKAFAFLLLSSLAAGTSLFLPAAPVSTSRIALAGLALLAALSASWSAAPALAGAATLSLAGGLLFLLSLDRLLARNDGWRWIFLRLLQVLAGIEIVVALGQMAGWSPLLFGLGEEPIALLGNRNYLAHFLVATLPALALATPGEGARVPWLRRLALAAGLFVLASTGCRAAWLALGAGLVVVFAFHRLGALRRRPGFAPLVAVALVLGGGVLMAPFAGRFGPAKAASMRARLLVWRLSAELVRERPMLGVGAGAYGNALAAAQEDMFRGLAPDRLRAGWRHARNFRQAHCDPLQVLVEQGLIGLVLAGAAVLAAASEIVGERPVGKAAAATLAAMTAGGLFSFPFHLVVTAPLALVWAALGRRGAFEGKEREGERERPSAASAVPVPAAVLVLLVASLALAGTAFAVSRFRAELALGEALRHMRTGWFDRALGPLETARRLAPWWGRPLHEEGRCLAELGRWDAALAAFDGAERLHLDWSVLANRARCLAGAKRFDEAEVAFRRAVALRPSAITARLMGDHLVERGRASEAEAWYGLALDASVLDYEAALALGRCLARQGRLREAVTRHQSNLQTLSGHWRHAGTTGFARGRILRFARAALVELRALWAGAKVDERVRQLDAEIREIDGGTWKGWTR